MRALVTGSAGFIGRHMSTELERRGYEVTHVDVRKWCDCCEVRDARWFFDWDVRQFDLVVHAAYHVGGRAAIDGEPRLLARNLELDASLFDWACRTGQGRVLYFSSSAAYPIDLQNDHATARSLRESDIRGGALNIGRPDARYGWAKLTGEQLALAAGESGLQVHVVRPFSGYGEDQDDTYPFRAFIERARRREDPFTVWGDGHQVRDWIHVDDVVAGALAVVDGGYRLPVNLCTGIGTSMLELVELVASAAGYEPRFATHPEKPAGVAYRVGDPTTFHKFHMPRVSLADGVERAMRT